MILYTLQEITLWRKSDRPRKMVMGYGPHGGQMVGGGGGPGGQNLPPGGPYAGGYVHQVPHAMARHNPGDYPSQNVRTAPTPSGPDDLLSPQGKSMRKIDGTYGAAVRVKVIGWCVEWLIVHDLYQGYFLQICMKGIICTPLISLYTTEKSLLN